VRIDADITLHHAGKMTYSRRFIDTLTKLAPQHPELIDPDVLGQGVEGHNCGQTVGQRAVMLPRRGSRIAVPNGESHRHCLNED
jgi:hypothetical protein